MTEQLFTREGESHKATVKDAKGKPGVMIHFPCSRCGGEGQSQQWAATGYTCYDCGGNGKHKRGPEFVRLYTADELAKMNATRDKARAKKAAANLAKREALIAAEDAARVERREALKSDPLFQLLTTYAERNEFVADMLGKLRVRDLSEKQIDAAKAACERIAATDKAAATSQHVGVVGERVKLDVVVRFARCIHQAATGYGSWINGRPDADRWLIKLEDAAGNVVVWFTANGYKEGAQLTGSATVAKHDAYNGIAQTTVKNFRVKRPKQEGDE